MKKIFTILIICTLFFCGCINSDSSETIGSLQISNSSGVINSLEIISIKPELPATLKTGERIEVKVRYKIGSVKNARIWVRPYTQGEGTNAYAAHASSLYETGEGELTGFFTVEKPGVTDEIRVRMRNENKGYFATISKPVQIKWED